LFARMDSWSDSSDGSDTVESTSTSREHGISLSENSGKGSSWS